MLDLSSVAIARALDGVFAQQMLRAHNIANANSANFSPLRLSFEQSLSEAVSAASVPLEDRAGARRLIENSSWSSYADPAGTLRLDLETVGFQRSASHYAALLTILEKQLQVQHLALNDGRSR